jgi:hypothetical protein
MKIINLEDFKNPALPAIVMALTMSSQFAGTKASQSHLCSAEFIHSPKGCDFVSIQNLSAGMIAEGGSPTESKAAQPDFTQGGSHVLAKTSDLEDTPKEAIQFTYTKEKQKTNT